MRRLVIVLLITIFALAVLGCSGSDNSSEIQKSPSVLATQEATITPITSPLTNSQPVSTESPTNSLPISTAPPTNSLPILSVVNTESNLRAGPGTEFDQIRIASVGQVVEVIGSNAANDWYKLASGEWIAAFLVDNAPDNLPVVEASQVAQEPAPTQAAQPIGAQLRIIALRRNGSQGENEPDEYVEMANIGDSPQDMTGWRLESEKRGDDTGQIFYFPLGFVIAPSQICRIYTNQHKPESCGLNFRHEGAIWSNYDPDAALLYDQAGNLVDRWE